METLERVRNERYGDIPLNDKVYNMLVRDILKGNIKIGSRLTERIICEKYQISRTPVREAMRYLALNGLIEHVPNCGARVKGLSKEEKEDLLLLRKDSEEGAVSIAIKRASEYDLKELEEIFSYMEFYTKNKDVMNMIDINLAFHRIIYKATKNKMLEKHLITYQKYLDYTTPTNYYNSNYLNMVLQEHRLIFNAFINKDPEAGKLAMKNHMNNSINRRKGLI